MPTIDDRRPVRSCVGCRTRRPVDELVRVTYAHDGSRPVVRVGGPSAGRGAWLCAATSAECAEVAIRRRGFDRAWRRTIDDATVDDVREEVRRVTSASDITPDEGTTTGKG